MFELLVELSKNAGFSLFIVNAFTGHVKTQFHPKMNPNLSRCYDVIEPQTFKHPKI